jgi:hypothetical protein
MEECLQRRATEKVKKEYLENTYDDIITFQIIRHYDLTHKTTNELGCKKLGNSKYWHQRCSREYNTTKDKY